MIPKCGRDSRILRNVRPISLLNCDYKLLEKVIANRIKPNLYHIIKYGSNWLPTWEKN